MTVLYSNDFEAETTSAALPNWETRGGVGLIVYAGTTGSAVPISGTKHYGRNSNNDSSFWTGGWSLTDQAVRCAQSLMSNGSSIGIVLRAAWTDQNYYCFFTFDGSNIWANIDIRNNGRVSLHTAASGVAGTAGDVVHTEARAVGTSIEYRVWVNSDARPSAATVSVTNGLYTSGAPGLRKYNTTNHASVDNLVITDATGGEDYWYAPVAPTVSAHPSAQSVIEPATAGFSVTLSGTYTGIQWEYSTDGGTSSAGNVPGGTGATSTSYTTGATAVSTGSYRNGYRYRAVVTWSGGTVNSNWAALTVSAAGTAPSITVQPSNQSVDAGSTANFSVTATGSGTLTYQWQRQPSGGGGYTNISAATSSSYTTPATTITGGSANNGDTYRCVVTGDTAPPATSNAATLTVLQPVATTVSVTLTTDGTTPAASLTGLKWAFYDQVTPDLFTAAPVVKGAAETTDGSGVFSASITGTTLRQGDVGYLIVTNSNGTTTQGAALKAFAAPVVVA